MKQAKRKPLPSVVRQKELVVLRERAEMLYNCVSSLLMFRLKEMLK